MIDTALYSILTGNAGVVALISTRVHMLTLPQNPTLPAAIYQRIGASRTLHHGGASKITESYFQIAVVGDDMLELKNVSAAIRQALHGYKGTVGAEVIYFIRVDSEIDLFDPDLENYQVVLDITIQHKET